MTPALLGGLAKRAERCGDRVDAIVITTSVLPTGEHDQRGHTVASGNLDLPPHLLEELIVDRPVREARVDRRMTGPRHDRQARIAQHRLQFDRRQLDTVEADRSSRVSEPVQVAIAVSEAPPGE